MHRADSRHPQHPKLSIRAIEALKHATNGTDLAGIERKRRACRAGAIVAVTLAMRKPLEMRAALRLGAHEHIEAADQLYRSAATLLYNLYGYVLAGGAGVFGAGVKPACSRCEAVKPA